MQQVTPQWLKGIEALQPVPSEQLQWFIDNSTQLMLQDGDCLISQNQPLNTTTIVISGKVRLYLMVNGVRTELVTMGQGHITGYLPYSRGKVSVGDFCAIGETQVMSFPIEKMMDMIKHHFELTQALVSVMSNRVRDSTALQQQNEKMMALGKLSAGLAHELNNPAASIVRNADSLKKHLQSQPEMFSKLVALKLDMSDVAGVKGIISRILKSESNTRLGLRERNKQEEEFINWFDEHEIDNGDELAENFVEQGFSISDLNEIYNHLTKEAASSVFGWIHDSLLSEKMVADIHHASQRIADLISSIKTFTHMDRGADRQLASIETGIRNTLTMLNHKIKACNITVTEEYDPNLPKVKMFVGELNQVWTNLIDNAIDAMEVNGKGNLTIRTRKDDDFAEVTITDDGPGIPDEIKTRIFDPFFTTKQMGMGTGMGLEVVQRIVKQQHQGSVKVNSKPGQTQFIICMPING
jgi:signal transduction histidine kinase